MMPNIVAASVQSCACDWTRSTSQPLGRTSMSIPVQPDGISIHTARVLKLNKVQPGTQPAEFRQVSVPLRKIKKHASADSLIITRFLS